MKKIISYLTVLFLTLTVMAAELPAGEFPGADGSAEVTLVFKKSDVKNQVIFQLYSVKGDIFYLRAAKNRLQAAFYDRSEKKWYRSTGNRPLPEKKACKAGVIWSIPGRIDITLDGKEAGGVAVDVPPVFDKKSQLTVGSDQTGGNKFAGEIKNLIFTSVKLI